VIVMATQTVSLPDTVKDWLEQQVKDGEYATGSDFLSDLFRRDREERDADRDERLDELRRIVDESIASGISEDTVEDRIATGSAILQERRSARTPSTAFGGPPSP
jgi:antitoxin ParD1/3/4